MVYLLVANKPQKYRNGRSRILYIGTTKKGADRPAASAVNKASEAFYQAAWGQNDFHVVSCAPRKAMQTWKRPESALLDVFPGNRYFQLPKYNKVRPTTTVGLFSVQALAKIIDKFDST